MNGLLAMLTVVPVPDASLYVMVGTGLMFLSLGTFRRRGKKTK